MFCLNHHRKYLGIFFFMFFTLTCIALGGDCVNAYGSSGAGAGGSGNGIKLAMPRFLNVVFVFVFSAVSALLQNSLSKKIINPDFFRSNKKAGVSKYIKVKVNKNIKKVARKTKYGQFILSSMFANLIHLIPAIVLVTLLLLDYETSLGDNLQKYFFGIALLIKYVSWHLAFLVTWLFVFRKNPRIRLNRV